MLQNATATATATRVGGRTANADAASAIVTPLGSAIAVVDGIGSNPQTCEAARRAAEHAAIIASHRGAQIGLLAAAQLYPDHDDTPNAVASVASVTASGEIEIAHAGDTAVYTWSTTAGLRRWTIAQTVGEHIRHMASNHRSLGDESRAALIDLGHQGLDVLDDYVLTGLRYADVHTISWKLLTGDAAAVDLVLIASDGVHKQISAARLAELVERHAADPQALTDALVTAAVHAVPDGDSDNATAAVLRLPGRVA